VKKVIQFVVLLATLALMIAAAAVLWKSVRVLLVYLVGVPKELGVALIAAAATIVVSTLTVVIGRYYERKRELDALYRDKKVEIYDEFLKQFFGVLFGSQNQSVQSEDMVPFLREFIRKLLLWSGPEPIATFTKWKEHMASEAPDAQSIFLTEDFLLALRKDLRHSNHGIPKGFFAQLYLKESALFLEAAAKNPKITLAELAILEKSKSQKTTGPSDVPNTGNEE
jgi:hypothetical protein